MIPAWVMVATVILVCITVVVCFVIWASRGADVDELASDLEDAEARLDGANTRHEQLKAQLDDLAGVVAQNALVLEAVRKKLGGEALEKLAASMGGAARPPLHGVRRNARPA